MGAFAGLLKALGFSVCGSDDRIYPPMSTQLRKLGIPLFSPYAAENLEKAKPDLVIVGNAISRDHAEAIYLNNAGIPFMSFPQALNHFLLKDKEVIVVSGTHGKTTTTALMAYLLTKLSLDPDFLVGGIVRDGEKNFHVGKGKYFVIEGDEYDTAFFDKGPKFLHYNPKHVIITSLEFDHADIYKDLDHVTSSFARLIDIIPQSGSLHYSDDSDRLKKLAGGFTGIKKPYGFSSTVSDYRVSENGSSFKLRAKSGDLQLNSPLTGKYNAANVAACFSVLENLGLDVKEAASAVKSFPGVKRRQEVLFADKHVVVIDDFAHHPTAVRETITAIKEKYPSHHVVAIFEPRSNTSRTNIFQREYTEGLRAADEVILAPVNRPEKVKDGAILDTEAIVAELKRQKKPAQCAQTTQEIIDVLLHIKASPKIALIMSNGDFDGLAQRLIANLSFRGVSRKADDEKS